MPRRVVIVALPEVQPLDVTGPAEVLASAASVAGGDDAAYTIEVVAPGGAPIPTDSGYAIAPAGALEAVRGPIDTLLVAGGAGARHASRRRSRASAALAARAEPRRVGVHRRVRARRRRPARRPPRDHPLELRATTSQRRHPGGHGRARPDLRRATGRAARPRASPPAWTSRSRSSRRTSAATSRSRSRAGSCLRQAPGRPGAVQRAARRPVRRARAAARAPGVDRRPPRRRPLRPRPRGARVHEPAPLRPRLQAETGMTPAVYVESLRVERARLALESAAAPIEPSPPRCGFGTVETHAARVRPAARGRARRLPQPLRRRQRPAPQGAPAMEIAIPLFDRFTALDAVGPYEVLWRAARAPASVRRRRGPARTRPTACLATRRRGDVRGRPRRPTCSSSRAAPARAPRSRTTSALARLDPPRRRDLDVDDLGVHRLAAARRGRAARRAASDDALGSTRPLARLRRAADRRARRRAGQDHHRRPASRRASTWP